MKNRASLVLMEQLMMILVFALAAALCLRIFAAADRTSREMELRDRAVVMAQNGAETVKACKGDLPKAAEMLGGSAGGGSLTAVRDGLTLEIKRISTEIPGLGRAEVSVTASEEVLFSLTTAWQEVP